MLTSVCFAGCGSKADALEKEKANAAAVFTLDINPGVRVYVRADNTVIDVEATNEDGKKLVADIEINGEDYETVVEKIVDGLEEGGYLSDEGGSVLLSIEKKGIEISEKINAKLEKAFEKYGKRASVIEQELNELGEEIEAELTEIAERYNISEGKARLIEKIREEHPEFAEEELAELTVGELAMLLEGLSDDIKEQFKKVGKAIEETYLGMEKAVSVALDSLGIAIGDARYLRAYVACDDGKMFYCVKFVYDGTEYEFEIDAKSGEIIETESEPYEEPDIDSIIADFCDKHGIELDKLKDQILNGIFGGHEENDSESDGEPKKRGEVLRELLDRLALSPKALKKTEIDMHRTENGIIYIVTIENNAGDVYELTVEAYSGAVVDAKLNGEPTALPEDTDR